MVAPRTLLRRDPLSWLAGLLLAGLAACGGGTAPAPEAPVTATDTTAAPGAASGEESFVVWESNRGGRWRIWTRPLAGGPSHRLTPDEGPRRHCCPLISPDGQRVAYLSLPPEGGAGAAGELRLIEVADGSQQVVAPRARSYGGGRAVVWQTAERLIYIGDDGYTYLRDLGSDATLKLTAEPLAEGGWLPDPTLSVVTTDEPTFSPFDPDTGRVTPRQPFGGCEPFFSQDGRWGYWMAGAGGPVYRIDLATREVSPVLGKNDPRLPGDQRYLYFPMLSRDGHAFAFGASAGEHDHARADYDVYVAETDPERLEVVGEVQRITEDPATDRYPDVWVAPLPLGRWQGEAPWTVTLTAPGPGAWSWQLGDGATARGPEVRHTYRRPGLYPVVARKGDQEVRGRVRVVVAAPPTVVDVAVREGRRVEVRFDEPVELAGAEVSLASGGAVAGWEPTAGGRGLEVDLEAPLPGPDTLLLAGVRDRAQEPNLIAPQRLPLAPATWPSRRQGLLFLWQTGAAANLVPAPPGEPARSYPLERQGRVRLDHYARMDLGGGAWVAGGGVAEALVAGCQGTNEWSLEATLSPTRPRQSATVLAFSGGPKSASRDFVLAQRGERLVLTLLTAGPRGGISSQVELPPLAAGRATHLVVSYRPGRLVAYYDGREVLASDAVQGGFFHWKARPLTFGREWEDPATWSGRLEGIALYGRALDAGEVAENARRYRQLREARRPVPRFRVAARLVAPSRTPTLEEIAPYREALAVYEWEVAESDGGGPAVGSRVRVAHWVILDGETLPAAGWRAGERRRLLLEPLADNPQLESFYQADTLPPDFAAETFYAARR